MLSPCAYFFFKSSSILFWISFSFYNYYSSSSVIILGCISGPNYIWTLILLFLEDSKPKYRCYFVNFDYEIEPFNILFWKKVMKFWFLNWAWQLSSFGCFSLVEMNTNKSLSLSPYIRIYIGSSLPNISIIAYSLMKCFIYIIALQFYLIWICCLFQYSSFKSFNTRVVFFIAIKISSRVY